MHVIICSHCTDYCYVNKLLWKSKIITYCTGVGKCNEGEFKCHDGTCIDADLACNGEEHCPDGSDEDDSACCYQGWSFALI